MIPAAPTAPALSHTQTHTHSVMVLDPHRAAAPTGSCRRTMQQTGDQ